MASALEAQAQDAEALTLWEKLLAMDAQNREAKDKVRRLKRRLLSARR
jgi:cytochrome c-type biogenesis protein CcmH/NrfG